MLGLPRPCYYLLILLAAVMFPACRRVPGDGLKLRRGEVTDGRLTVPYRVYVPLGFSYTRPWPVILYLHGFGERGEDGEAPLRAGIGPILRQYPECFPCLIVIPQAPRSRVRWEGDVNELALKALEAVVQQYGGDRRRLYVTGVSMGGAGCWRIVAKYPRRFAAVMPICGRSEPRSMAPKLARLPIWVFHGAKDRIVPVQCSREMVKALRATGNARVRYTEYPDVGHNAWDRAYGDPANVQWLLAQKR